MITIKDFMEAIEYRITDGSPYQWQCYGSSAHHISYENTITGSVVNIIFDTINQEVYEMQAWDGLNKKEYRWINPRYVEDLKVEYNNRAIPFDESIDNRNFIDLEVESDMLEKASAIYKGVAYDTRVQIDLTLSKDEQHALMELAHKKDMSLNQLVEYILKEYIQQNSKAEW